MDKDKICKSIRDQLEDILEQVEIIRGYEGKIPSIELDLILSNIRDLYENMLQLEKMNQPLLPFTAEERKSPPEAPPAEPEPIVIRVRKPEPPNPEPPSERLTSISRVEEPLNPEPPSERLTPINRVEETQNPEPINSDPEQLVIRIKPPEEPKPVKTTLDLFGESSATLADKLKDNNEKRIADKLKDNKISDLKAAIGINEKFLYINELFDGSLRDYEDAVQRLNGCTDPDEGSMIIFELRERYHWDLDNPAVRSFIELVNRKF